jgi:hypothetical protein
LPTPTALPPAGIEINNASAAANEIAKTALHGRLPCWVCNNKKQPEIMTWILSE